MCIRDRPRRGNIAKRDVLADPIYNSKMVTKEFKGLVHGDYGKTPAPIKPEFTKKILGDEPVSYTHL